jgi:hypothetical protein
MDLTARIEAVDGTNSRLVGASEVSMSGKAAAFGGRMMQAVADQVLKQFADNFAIQVKAAASAEPHEVDEPPQPQGADSGTGAGKAGGAEPAVGAASGAMPSGDGPTTAKSSLPRPAPAPVAPPSAPAPLNGAALAWAVFKDWLRSLFAPRKA